MCVFALIKKQYGFVIEICKKAKQNFHDDIFEEITKYAIKKMNREGYLKIPFYLMSRFLAEIAGIKYKHL